jgi:hypothetical protein
LENSRLEVRHCVSFARLVSTVGLRLYLPKPGSARNVTKKMRTRSPSDLDAAMTGGFPV